MRPDCGQFTSLDDKAHGPEAASEDGSKEEYDRPSLESLNKREARYKRRAMLVAFGARLMQVLLLLNLVVLTVLLFVDSSLQDSSKVSCSPRVIEQILMPLNVLLGLLVLALPRCTEYNGRSRGLQHTIITPVVKVSDCDYVIPDYNSNSHLAEGTILEEGAAVDCTDVNCEDFGGDDSPRHVSGSCTPVEDLMHELMQVALSLCSAAPQECRGLLANCSYEERQAVHILGQMVRNHLFPEADGIEDNGALDHDQPALEHQRTPGMLSGFNVSIASDGARSEASGTHAQRWNMLNDAVDTFLFGTSSGAEQVNAQVPGLQLPVQPAERENLERESMDETPESRPKTADSDRPSAPTVTPPQEVTGPTASPTQNSTNDGSADQSPREMSEEEIPESPKSPFSVPEVSLTVADSGFDRTKPVMIKTGVNGDFHVPMQEDLEAARSSQPHATQVGRRNSNQSASSKKSGKRRMSGQSAASRHESRRSSVSSANSQFSATSFTDFNRRQSHRGSATSVLPPAVRRGSGDSQKPSGRKGDKSKYSTNSSCKSNQHSGKTKDKSRYNTGSSSHPSEVVRGLLKAIAAQPNEEVGGVSWSRDGCAADCSEMESERLASINLANRYRYRSESMDETSRSCGPPDAAERQERRSHTVGYSAHVEQELRDACQAVFPNSPRSQAASRRASTVSGQQGEGLRSFGSLAIPKAHENRRGSNALSVVSAHASDVERKHSLQLPGPDSPNNRRPSGELTSPNSPKLGHRKLSNVSGSLQLPDSLVGRRLSNSSRRLSNSLAWSPLPSQGSSHNNGTSLAGSNVEGDGSSNANWGQRGSRRSCSLSSEQPRRSSASGRQRTGAGTDHFRFTSVGTRLRENLKKLTGRGDKSKRTSTTGALSRLKKWGLPPYVKQAFVDYAERTQASHCRQVLGFKCVDELAAEVEAGLCRIVAGEPVTRVVQVCALRILAPVGERGIKQDLVLVQKWHRSRKGGWFRKNALPSTKLRGQEEPREAAKRMLEDEFGEFTEFLKLQDDAPLEELVQEKESTSYPGLLTRYVTTIVEVRIRPEVDTKALADMGLGPECREHLQGSILTDSEAGETSYDWMQTKHCRVQGIPVAGVKDYMTLEVLREQEDQDSDDGNALESRPDPVELVRVLREATDTDPHVSLKDMVHARGEILELSLEELAKGFYRGADNVSNVDHGSVRTPSSSSRFQTCPCTPSGTLLSDDTNDAPLSCVAPLPTEGALPKKGSLFQILSLMQHMQAQADEPQNLDERRRSWGEKSHAMSENSVSTAMLWKMAMQDWDFDRQTVSGSASKKSSPPPVLDMLEHRAPLSRVPTNSEALFRDLCEQLEAADLHLTDSSKDKRREKFSSRGSARNYAEKFNSVTPPESDPQPRIDGLAQDASSANAAASASKECLATNGSAQVSTATGSNESAETPSTQARTDVPDPDSHEEKVRRYAERKARRKSPQQQAGEDEPPVADTPAGGEDAGQASSSACHSNAQDSNANETSASLSSFGAEEESEEEKTRKYEARKARLKAKKANAKPGQVNYGEILRNAYEQFPIDHEGAKASSQAQAEQGGASSSSAAPPPSELPEGITDKPEKDDGAALEKDDGVKHTTSGGSLESKSSGPESPGSSKSNHEDGGIGPEGLWEVVRNLVAAGESPSPEPDDKPMTQDEKMKQWRERKERRKSKEMSKKRPSYGTLLKKESSPRSSPSPTPSDDASSDLPIQIKVVGTPLSSGPCSASTSLFGGRQSAGSQNLGFEFSAGLVQANGRLSLPKTLLAPIPSPPGSRRASELERDEEDDEDDGTRRSPVAVSFREDACMSEPLSSPDSCFGPQEEEDTEQQGVEEVGNVPSLVIHMAVPDDHRDEEADEDMHMAPPCDESSGAELCKLVAQRLEQPSGGEPASLCYSREQQSTDTLEQAIEGLGV